MKSGIKEQNGKILVEIPPAYSARFSNSLQVNVYSPREGMLIVCTEEARSGVFGAGPNAPPSSAPREPALSGEEQALVSKLARIRFFERTQKKVGAALSPREKSLLAGMLERKIITIFKNSKYPEGVYNISNRIYFMGRRAGGAPAHRKPSTGTPGRNFGAAGGPALAINTVEHLQKLGYMVLSSEAEAKYQMERIKEKVKDDEVKGVRGFDKKYYILRKSFLREFERPIFSLLDTGLSLPKEMSKKLNLTPEAITVILMVMADEGLVIEPRRGEWAKA